MAMYLSSQRVLLKDFQPFAKKISQQIIKHAQALAEKSSRRFEYISSSRTSKEEVAGRIMKLAGAPSHRGGRKPARPGD